jgi:hypothetical protein
MTTFYCTMITFYPVFAMFLEKEKGGSEKRDIECVLVNNPGW